ncbi:uncharacterized protein LOC127262794 isoform X1 [Andrographis paniculata]|uniref:uncharacterized protein LOC127262794 isoform X1 n=1 Tax=Andrographis paniculata TaxID=175694 RepID=UPI0021E71AA4|nr:uncharacterized protein LOC127262794 isoform X1 [Andrographis paniculata]
MHKARLLSGDIYIAQVFSQRFIRILPLISELKRTSGVFAEIAWAGIVSYLLLYMLASHNAPGVSKKQSRPTSSITIIHDLIQQAMVLLTYRVKMEQKVQLLTPIMNCKTKGKGTDRYVKAHGKIPVHIPEEKGRPTNRIVSTMFSNELGIALFLKEHLI